MRNLTTSKHPANCTVVQNGTIVVPPCELSSPEQAHRTDGDFLADLHAWRRQRAASWDVEFGADAAPPEGLVS